MRAVLQQMPVDAAVMVPLVPLRDLIAHKRSFLPGWPYIYVYKARKLAYFCQSLPGIFTQERALAVDHLIVRQRKHEILGEGVDHAEGEIIMMIFAMDRIFLEVFQSVVHPAHVPFHAKAQTPGVRRARDHRPGGRFFGDHLHIRIGGVHDRVESLINSMASRFSRRQTRWGSTRLLYVNNRDRSSRRPRPRGCRRYGTCRTRTKRC